MIHYKLGKKAARPGAVTFKLSRYILPRELPQPPASFGHEGLIGADQWLMLGNDEYGDCVFAGAAHETMMWRAEVLGHPTRFSARNVLRDYADVTGFSPDDPSTDQGTDMAAAADYRRKTGVRDATGHHHKVAAYLAIEPGNLTQHYQAMYLFGCVGIGLDFPNTAMDQFDRHQPWDVVSGASSDGGHYVPLVAHRGNLVCVSWARAQGMTPRFLSKYNDESLAYVSLEALAHNRSPEGFDSKTLLADLAQLGKKPA
jgi:hypothetical protein